LPGGNPGSTGAIEIYGAFLSSGSTPTVTIPGVTITGYPFVSDQQVNVSYSIPAAVSLGARNLSLQTARGVSTTNPAYFVSTVSLSASATQEQGKPNHYFCLKGSSDLTITASLNPSNTPDTVLVWQGGAPASDNVHRKVSCGNPGDVTVGVAVGLGAAQAASMVVHVIDGQTPVSPGSLVPKTWTSGGSANTYNNFGNTVVSIGQQGVVAPTYSVDPYWGGNAWVFRLASVRHVYKLGVLNPPVGLPWYLPQHFDLPTGNPTPFPLAPGATLTQGHSQARSDLDTSQPCPSYPGVTCAPLSLYYVSNAIVAHENAHVDHFYTPQFQFWDQAMRDFQNIDVEASSVNVVYNCSDSTTTSGTGAVNKMASSWNQAIAQRHTAADKAELSTLVLAEIYCYSIENPIETNVRNQVPNP
jgi:hypothetical protein